MGGYIRAIPGVSTVKYKTMSYITFTRVAMRSVFTELEENGSNKTRRVYS